jgi:hypothetical protein
MRQYEDILSLAITDTTDPSHEYNIIIQQRQGGAAMAAPTKKLPTKKLAKRHYTAKMPKQKMSDLTTRLTQDVNRQIPHTSTTTSAGGTISRAQVDRRVVAELLDEIRRHVHAGAKEADAEWVTIQQHDEPARGHRLLGELTRLPSLNVADTRMHLKLKRPQRQLRLVPGKLWNGYGVRALRQNIAILLAHGQQGVRRLNDLGTRLLRMFQTLRCSRRCVIGLVLLLVATKIVTRDPTNYTACAFFHPSHRLLTPH